MVTPNTASSVISSETVSGTNVYNPAGDKLGTCLLYTSDAADE